MILSIYYYYYYFFFLLEIFFYRPLRECEKTSLSLVIAETVNAQRTECLHFMLDLKTSNGRWLTADGRVDRGGIAQRVGFRWGLTADLEVGRRFHRQRTVLRPKSQSPWRLSFFLVSKEWQGDSPREFFFLTRVSPWVGDHFLHELVK